MTSDTCTLTVPFIPESELLSISKDSPNVKEMKDMCFRVKDSNDPLSKEDAYCCYDKCKSLFIDGGDDETEQTMFLNNPMDLGIGTNDMEIIQDGTQVLLDSDTSSYSRDTVVSQCGNVLKYNFANIIKWDDLRPLPGFQNRVDLRNICKKNSFYDESHKESFLKSFRETRHYDYIINDDGKYPNPMFTDICGCYYPDDWEKRFMESWTNTHLPGTSQATKDRAIANRSNIKKQCNDALCNISHGLNYVGKEFSTECDDILCIQNINVEIGSQRGGSQSANQEMNCLGEQIQESNTPGDEDTSGDTSEDTSGDTGGDTSGDTGGDTSGDTSGGTSGGTSGDNEGQVDKKEKEEESSGISTKTLLVIGGIIFFFFFMLMFMILAISM